MEAKGDAEKEGWSGEENPIEDPIRRVGKCLHSEIIFPPT